MDKRDAKAIRGLLAEFLGFLKHKVEKGSLTLEEQQALLRVFEESLPVYATADDLAAYYGKTKDAVHLIVHRKLLSKPKRRVLYDFREFRRVIPEKWRK